MAFSFFINDLGVNIKTITNKLAEDTKIDSNQVRADIQSFPEWAWAHSSKMHFSTTKGKVVHLETRNVCTDQGQYLRRQWLNRILGINKQAFLCNAMGGGGGGNPCVPRMYKLGNSEFMSGRWFDFCIQHWWDWYCETMHCLGVHILRGKLKNWEGWNKPKVIWGQEKMSYSVRLKECKLFILTERWFDCSV